MGKHYLRGDFEGSTTGWTTGGTNTVAKSADQARSGAHSLKFTYSNSILFYTNLVTLPVGVYSCSAYLYVPTAYNGGAISVGLTDFSGATGTTVATANLSLRDEWQRISIPNVTLDAGDLEGAFSVFTLGSAPSAGRTLYLDDVQLEDGAEVTDYDTPLDGRFAADALMKPRHRLTMRPLDRTPMRPLGRF